jgi:hypothetical protein
LTWNSALTDINGAGALDGTVAGISSSLDTLASYGLMPESNYYVNWADGGNQGTSPTSYGMSTQSLGFFLTLYPTCAQKQGRIDSLKKVLRGVKWAKWGFGGVAVVAAIFGAEPVAWVAGVGAVEYELAELMVGEQLDNLEGIFCWPLMT